MIKGEKVILIEKTMSGRDPFGVPIYDYREVEVDNVIVGTPSTDDLINDVNIYGKSLMFTLGIPKGDTHNWKDAEVFIRGELYKTYGFPLTQTDANVPLAWNTQVKVERYE